MPSSKNTMRPLADLSRTEASRIRAVFTDIDDTLTTDGKLLAPAFSALWALHDADIAVIPVTGRPAGWCDHFARMWPVAGIVGENGAFYFRYDDAAKRLVSRFLLDAAERATLQARLRGLGEDIMRRVPGCALASDQAYRIHDLAIDYCEDVPPLSREAVQEIVSTFRAAGATAKVSSIHVNGWFGNYDKLGMIKLFAREVLGLDLDDPKARKKVAYSGDSPNDEPAFAFFEHAIGVANIRRFAADLEHPPRWVTRSPGGRGFAELARHLLRAKKPARHATRGAPHR